MKFKYSVGDKVRVIPKFKSDVFHIYKMENNSHHGWCVLRCMHDFCGKVVTIEAIDEIDQCYYIKEMAERLRWTDEMFEELVEDKKVFTKNDLKNGDVVLKRNGSVEIVVLPLGTLITNDEFSGWNDLNDIKDDLTSSFYDSFDIIAVRRPSLPGHCRFSAFEHENGELVYDRERDTKPLYNGKVVCIDATINQNLYTVGKIYQFKDGRLTGDNGKAYPEESTFSFDKIYTFEDWKNWSSSKWLEIKE